MIKLYYFKYYYFIKVELPNEGLRISVAISVRLLKVLILII